MDPCRDFDTLQSLRTSRFAQDRNAVRELRVTEIGRRPQPEYIPARIGKHTARSHA